ncbi:MAG: TRAP transporter substrate-binding protein DctP [Acidobacteriota bacterium]
MRTNTSILAAVLALSLAAPGVTQTVTVKMATLVPQGSAWHTTLQEMAEAWKAASGGKVTLRLYPGGVAGDDSDVVRKMRLGTLDAGLLTAVGLADVDRSVFALAVPMAYESYDEVDHVLEKMSPRLEQAFEAKGFIVLNWADAGWLRFFTKSPVRTPDDLRALKLFVWSGDSLAVEMWKAAGFNPVPLPSTEIATALQTGLVSAVPTTPQAAVLLQWYVHAPNMTEIDWALLLGGTMIAKRTWEKIPVDLRPALRDAAREAGRKWREQTRAAAERDVDAMKARGLKVWELDAASEAAWRKAVDAAYPTLRGSFVPTEAFDTALRLRDEYRRSRAAR